MRGCLSFFIGAALGAALMVAWWPRQPFGVVAPSRADVHITLSDGYIGRRIQQATSRLMVPTIKSVSVRSIPPSALSIRATAVVGPLRETLTMEVQPLARAGQLQVHVVFVQLAGIPVPGSLIESIARSINVSTQPLLRQHLSVNGVSVSPFGLEIFAAHR